MQAAVSASFVDANPVDGDPPELQNSALASGENRSAGLKVVTGSVPTPKTDPSVPVPGFSQAAHLGVVFFRANGIDQRCTGNAVVSDSGNVVATSGRCVSALPGKFVSDLVFVPGYNGTAPYGVWPATTITADNRWVADRAVDYDTAFFQVQAPTTMKPPAPPCRILSEHLVFASSVRKTITNIGQQATTPTLVPMRTRLSA